MLVGLMVQLKETKLGLEMDQATVSELEIRMVEVMAAVLGSRMAQM